MGLETTRILSNAGASVFVGVRDLQKAQGALADMKNVSAAHLDLAEPGSVDAFAEAFSLPIEHSIFSSITPGLWRRR